MATRKSKASKRSRPNLEPVNQCPREKTRWTRSEVNQLLASQRKEPTVYDKLVDLDRDIEHQIEQLTYIKASFEQAEDKLREMNAERARLAEEIRQQVLR